MNDIGFKLKFALMLVAQVLMLNYLNFSQYLTPVFLPVMVLCTPIRRKTTHLLLLAFACGFLTDFLAGGMLGLTSLALLPVALVRNGVITLVFGSEVFSRMENISARRQGWGKVALATLIVTALFLAVYIWADGAGTRPFWFNFARFAASLAGSLLLSLVVADILFADKN